MKQTGARLLALTVLVSGLFSVCLWSPGASGATRSAAPDVSNFTGGWQQEIDTTTNTVISTYTFTDASSADVVSPYVVVLAGAIAGGGQANVFVDNSGAGKPMVPGVTYTTQDGLSLMQVCPDDAGSGEVTFDQLAQPLAETGVAARYSMLCDNGILVTGAIAVGEQNVAAGAGYYTYDQAGRLFAYGNDSYLVYMGNLTLQQLPAPIVGSAATSDGNGYWMVGAGGAVYPFGDAQSYGSPDTMHLNAPVVGMAPTADGNGYWLLGSDGGIFSYGDAKFDGSMGGVPLNAPVVGMAATADGGGYWLVASDGGIFSFGDATFYGSMGGIPLNSPVVGMAPTPDGGGYWLVASDGGIFSFGDAKFYGSMGGIPLNSPVVGMAPTADGNGYWLVASDGGIFSFGDAEFSGSAGGQGLSGFTGIFRS